MTPEETRQALALTADPRVGLYEWPLEGAFGSAERFFRLAGVGRCEILSVSEGEVVAHRLISDQEAQNHLSEHFRAWLAERGWSLRLDDARHDYWSIYSYGEYRGTDTGYFPALLTAVEMAVAEEGA